MNIETVQPEHVEITPAHIADKITTLVKGYKTVTDVENNLTYIESMLRNYIKICKLNSNPEKCQDCGHKMCANLSDISPYDQCIIFECRNFMNH